MYIIHRYKYESLLLTVAVTGRVEVCTPGVVNKAELFWMRGMRRSHWEAAELRNKNQNLACFFDEHPGAGVVNWRREIIYPETSSLGSKQKGASSALTTTVN
jgi:hypothetical protein